MVGFHSGLWCCSSTSGTFNFVLSSPTVEDFYGKVLSLLQRASFSDASRFDLGLDSTLS